MTAAVAEGNSFRIIIAVGCLAMMAACAPMQQSPPPLPSPQLPVAAPLVLEAPEPVILLSGRATYYSNRFEGRATASGEVFRQSRLTAAANDLPFGTVATVTNQENGLKVDVVINDRIGGSRGRFVLDLSRGAADQIGMTAKGVVPVLIEARPSRQADRGTGDTLRRLAMDLPQ